MYRLRNNIRNFIAAHEIGALRIWNAIIVFVSISFLNSTMGYQTLLDHWYVPVLVAIVCAFLPLNAGAVIVMAITLIHLLALSVDVAIAGAILIVLSALLCGYFHAHNFYNTVVVPVSFVLRTPNLVALGSGLFRSVNEIATVICGGIITFYLRVIRINASTILDQTSNVSVIALIKQQMISEPLFYFYLVTLVAVFLVCYFMRQINIPYSWMLASGTAVLMGFLIMLIGYTVTGSQGYMPWLVGGSLITFLVGVFFDFFFRDLDFSRLEKLQFEDDDYYYYVTAVPKLKLTKEEKRIKRI